MGPAPAPRFVAAVLAWPGTWFLARLALVGAYLLGGIMKASDWPTAVAEMAHFGMNPPALWAAITIAVELIGPALILTGRLLWLGTGIMGVNALFEHAGLVGGFVLMALVTEPEESHA